MENFKHIQSAHCENGVTSSLMDFYGVKGITEPLAFGIGAGLFYIHIPFMKINGGPAVSYRSFPGIIFKRTSKLLNVPIVRKKFNSEEKAMDYLDDLLEQGRVTGCQVGVYNLPYFAPEYRFHFNAHNIIVYGKQGENYLISDPTMEVKTVLTREELQLVRFAKGPLAPKGNLYAPEKKIITDVDIPNAIRKGIKKNYNFMKAPGPFVGLSGIGYTAKQITKWRDKLGVRRAGLHLGQIIRMQEEIGTGGGGFRYIYAAFLEEAHAYIPNDSLLELSNDFTQSGDLWRNTAVAMAQVLKGRKTDQADFIEISERLREIEVLETRAFKKIGALKLI